MPKLQTHVKLVVTSQSEEQISEVLEMVEHFNGLVNDFSIFESVVQLVTPEEQIDD